MNENTGMMKVITYGCLGLSAFLFLAPLVFMLSVSLKPANEVLNSSVLPSKPTIAPYKTIIGVETSPETSGGKAAELSQGSGFNYLLYARNTLLIAVLSVIGMVLASSIAAYGFARLEFPGRKLMFAICLATMMIPFPVLMVPTYMVFKYLGWIGTFKPLWVPAWFGSAFNIFLLRQFFMGIPRELEESAMIDGATRWGCFWRVIMPLSVPALSVVILFHTLYVWNDLVGPLIYLAHQDQFTLALGLQFLQSRSGDTPWNQLMAAATLIVLPVIILFLFAQRTFIRGIATSGLKG